MATTCPTTAVRDRAHPRAVGGGVPQGPPHRAPGAARESQVTTPGRPWWTGGCPLPSRRRMCQPRHRVAGAAASYTTRPTAAVQWAPSRLDQASRSGRCRREQRALPAPPPSTLIYTGHAPQPHLRPQARKREQRGARIPQHCTSKPPNRGSQTLTALTGNTRTRLSKPSRQPGRRLHRARLGAPKARAILAGVALMHDKQRILEKQLVSNPDLTTSARARSRVRECHYNKRKADPPPIKKKN